MKEFLLIYCIAINAIAFLFCVLDKKRAKAGQWRIKERTLLLLCVAGGSPAFWFGMRLFRHKTKTAKFRFGVPAIFIIQIAVVCAVCYLFMQ